MKEVSRTALEHILKAHPGAIVEESTGTVRIPRYDIETDRAWFDERKIINGPDETRMGILPVFNVRKGATFNPDGEPRVGAFGQLYRILGWSPPAEEDK